MKVRYLALAVALSCGQNNTLPQQATGEHIVVTITGGNLGTAGSPQPINFSPSNPYTTEAMAA